MVCFLYTLFWCVRYNGFTGQDGIPGSLALINYYSKYFITKYTAQAKDNLDDDDDDDDDDDENDDSAVEDGTPLHAILFLVYKQPGRWRVHMKMIMMMKMMTV